MSGEKVEGYEQGKERALLGYRAWDGASCRSQKNKQRINRSKEGVEKNRLTGRKKHEGLEANSA